MLLDEHELYGLAPLRLRLLMRPRRQSPADFSSRDKGLGLEFADYQLFQPGDDIRHVDWTHFHKDGRLVVRKYDQHETVAIHLMMDLSASMACLGEDKPRVVKRLCAALAFCLLHNGAKVVLHPVGHPSLRRRFSAATQWETCQGAIEALPVGGVLTLVDEVRQFCYASSRRDHLIVLSDFLTDHEDAGLASCLGDLSHRAVLIHPTCAAEVEPALEGGLTLVEAESAGTASLTVDRQVIAAYQQAYRQYYDGLRQDAERCACRYLEVACDDPLHRQMESLAPNGVLNL
ncbi:MAG TPA: DUF58 domain-containing protein [Sedimentisphaerales bacterium]|jgi:uncharacterized protein (DUF58 family)|nr:DUF58 domain-containing protein [Sedimentisphaerales bacterium]HNU29296.1 DUF58 domain-containing protein [Sedimentisphaerales bacterium]